LPEKVNVQAKSVMTMEYRVVVVVWRWYERDGHVVG